MHLSSLLLPLLGSTLSLALTTSQSQLSTPKPTDGSSSLDLGQNLNLTVLGARNNRSTLECWAIEPEWSSSAQKGESGAALLNLGHIGGGSAGNSSFTVMPPNFNGGKHNAPSAQYVIILEGLAHITLPDSDAEAWIPGGQHGVLLALDTADVSAEGHYTNYPSERTVALQIPLGAGGVPKHRVLHMGACSKAELNV